MPCSFEHFSHDVPSALLARAAEWSLLHDQFIDSTYEWQRFESELFENARRQGLTVDSYRDTSPSEADAMEVVSQQIEELDVAMNILAAERSARCLL